MYSLILMSALAGSPDASAFGWRTGCTGCTGVVATGCTGMVASGCYGSSCTGCTGCYGSSCTGCTGCYGSSCYGSAPVRGGLIFGIGARMFSRPATCYGSSCHGSACYGSCYGSSCHGSACYGSCYGSSCHGSSCMGSSCYGCHGSYAAPVHFGCTGCGGYIVGSTAVAGPAYAVTIPEVTTTVAVSENAPAKLTVELPATAKLYVDGTLTKLDGSVRVFSTPELPKGQAFYYDLKAEIVVDGKTTVEQKQVVVRGGEAITESFPKLVAAIADAKTTVASK